MNYNTSLDWTIMRHVIFQSVLILLSLIVLPTGNHVHAQPNRFGERQISQILEDRPEMRGVVTRNSPIWKFVEERFETGDCGARIYWVSNEPVSGQDAEYALRYGNTPTHVFLTSKNTVSGVDKWASLVFELHNTENVDAVSELSTDVKKGRVGKSQFVERGIKLEFEALKKTQAFFKQNPIFNTTPEESPWYHAMAARSDDFDYYLRLLRASNRASDKAYLDYYSMMFDSLKEDSGGNKGDDSQLYPVPLDTLIEGFTKP